MTHPFQATDCKDVVPLNCKIQRPPWDIPGGRWRRRPRERSPRRIRSRWSGRPRCRRRPPRSPSPSPDRRQRHAGTYHVAAESQSRICENTDSFIRDRRIRRRALRHKSTPQSTDPSPGGGRARRHTPGEPRSVFHTCLLAQSHSMPLTVQVQWGLLVSPPAPSWPTRTRRTSTGGRARPRASAWACRQPGPRIRHVRYRTLPQADQGGPSQPCLQHPSRELMMQAPSTFSRMTTADTRCSLRVEAGHRRRCLT